MTINKAITALSSKSSKALTVIKSNRAASNSSRNNSKEIRVISRMLKITINNQRKNLLNKRNSHRNKISRQIQLSKMQKSKSNKTHKLLLNKSLLMILTLTSRLLSRPLTVKPKKPSKNINSYSIK